MVLHQYAFHGAQRFMNGGHLHQHVRAVAFVFHHLLDSADLSLNPAEARALAALLVAAAGLIAGE
jgi:hypothetical protein